VTKKVAALALLVVSLALPASRAAANSVTFGINDNLGLYEFGHGDFWPTLARLGLTSNTIALRWNERAPHGFDGKDGMLLATALAGADAAGIAVEFDVYPRHAAELADPRGPSRFAAFLSYLAHSYPEVKQYVVMNECNQDLFVNPQMRNGKNVSAARCGAFLAAGYDALKAVDPDIFVWGLGLSPRGNERLAGNPPSTDPIDWLGFLGAWYRSSGRSLPLMDGLDVHPYPVPQSLPFATGYANPHNYSVANLPRVYQAFYDAFKDTWQPTIGASGRLPVQLNEVGIQTSGVGRPGYTGRETGATADGGIRPPYDSEAYQARWYAQLVDYAECDADIRAVNIFKLVDESSLEGWQSGLFYTGYVPKMSAAAVKREIARVAGRCPSGRPALWASPNAPADVLMPGSTIVGQLAAGLIRSRPRSRP
jgi:hypothetical protein